MATVTVRNLKDEVRDRIRVVAARKGRSMESELREHLEKSYGNPSAGENESLDEIAKRLEKARAIAAKYLPDDWSVDDFIEERRKMWGEKD